VTGRLLDYAAPVLRAARTAANVSQAEMAERAGVSGATISRMETGQAWPSGTNVESVIDAYATVTGHSQLDFLERIVRAWQEDERGGPNGRHSVT
jgi:transcriptional regulator with XRE-family HTH domain